MNDMQQGSDQEGEQRENIGEKDNPLNKYNLLELVSNTDLIIGQSAYNVVDVFYEYTSQMCSALGTDKLKNFEISRKDLVSALEDYDNWINTDDSKLAMWYESRVRVDTVLRNEYLRLMLFKDKLKNFEG